MSTREIDFEMYITEVSERLEKELGDHQTTIVIQDTEKELRQGLANDMNPSAMADVLLKIYNQKEAGLPNEARTLIIDWRGPTSNYRIRMEEDGAELQETPNSSGLMDETKTQRINMSKECWQKLMRELGGWW